ncbi:hypothetical protein ACSYAD_31200 [Acaryochloris marina NIES-2412]|uniref:hypothetical protein n=1 Tax=Acaryochloris marina TaxID=155978 RepID=UPI004058D855
MSPSQNHAFALLPAFTWGCCIIGILRDGWKFWDWYRVCDRKAITNFPDWVD